MVMRLGVMGKGTPGLVLALCWLYAVLAGWSGRSEMPSRCCAALPTSVCARFEGVQLMDTAQMRCLQLARWRLRP